MLDKKYAWSLFSCPSFFAAGHVSPHSPEMARQESAVVLRYVQARRDGEARKDSGREFRLKTRYRSAQRSRQPWHAGHLETGA